MSQWKGFFDLQACSFKKIFPLNHEFLEGQDDHSFTSLSFTTSSEAIHQARWEFYHIIKDRLVPMQYILLQNIEK